MHSPQRPIRFEAVPVLPLPDGTVLHRSSRTSMAVNAAGAGRTTTAVVTSQLMLSVERGALQIGCGGKSLQLEDADAMGTTRRRARHARDAQ